MIERVYVDNFCTFSNFEINFRHLNLLLGPNGAGKTNLFRVLRSVQSLISGDCSIHEKFTPDTITRWDARDKQSVELTVNIDRARYSYQLQIEHDPDHSKRRIAHESLSYSGEQKHNQVLYTSDAGRGQLFRDDGSLGPEVLVDWSRSGLAFIHPRKENALLTTFKRAIRSIWIAAPEPSMMTGAAKEEVEVPDYRFGNFASWYRYMSQERQSDAFELTQTLRTGVLEGFDSFRLQRVGDEERRLQLLFDVGIQESNSRGPIVFDFEEMSDGQKMLVALYAMYQFALRGGNTFCLDQPENFLALPEIQPWLNKVTDAADEGRGQVIIITHHPELIDLLANDSGYWFERQDAGPTRVHGVSSDGEKGLSISELIARGWLSAE